MASEQAFCFTSHHCQLPAIFHPGKPGASRGVIVIVGGPQYRVGSHRQFVLLARHLADLGIPALRFDYRGMGEAEGEPIIFESAVEDLPAAVDALISRAPEVKEVVLWGLCDGASAAVLYSYNDHRISGLVLLNPWVRTEVSMAQAYLKHYYLQRLGDAEFRRKLLRGQWKLKESIQSLYSQFRIIWQRPAPSENKSAPVHGSGSLPDRMVDALQRFSGHVLIVLSGNDLTAAEFKTISGSPTSRWRWLLAEERFTWQELASANHTFSRQAWRDQVATWTSEWLQSW